MVKVLFSATAYLGIVESGMYGQAAVAIPFLEIPAKQLCLSQFPNRLDLNLQELNLLVNINRVFLHENSCSGKKDVTLLFSLKI